MDPTVVITGLLGLLGTTWAAFIAAFFRGDLIPGHVYRREVKRGDTATTQAERNADAVKGLTATIREERESRRADISAAVLSAVKEALRPSDAIG